jgi:hypothetical protein
VEFVDHYLTMVCLHVDPFYIHIYTITSCLFEAVLVTCCGSTMCEEDARYAFYGEKNGKWKVENKAVSETKFFFFFFLVFSFN